MLHYMSVEELISSASNARHRRMQSNVVNAESVGCVSYHFMEAPYGLEFLHWLLRVITRLSISIGGLLTAINGLVMVINGLLAAFNELSMAINEL